LAITKQLVQLHNGKIWATSIKREGSQFHVTLSIAKEKASKLSADVVQLSKVEK